ncbi:MAG TPA: HD domain-containing protein [Gemmatimonadales bacterium]|nr:HD domain-containing protein [Gemmatimonadales bacterium]
MTAERRAHIERVAGLLAQWAATLGVPAAEAERWRRAAWLHDALRDAPAATELEHGPLCADRLVRDGERDRGLLDAVRYHSLGYAGWDDVGRMLYLADYLEPGRRFDAPLRTALRERMPGEHEAVLREVARRRIEWMLRSSWALKPETVEFWNALASG